MAVATVVALMPSSAGAAQTLASCSASNPRVSVGGIDDAAACTASFITTEPLAVTTRLDASGIFAGWMGLRVRGTNALWTQYDGYFAGGQLILGQETSSFTLQPGSWQLEVYIDDPNDGLTGVGRFGYGTFGGHVTT